MPREAKPLYEPTIATITRLKALIREENDDDEKRIAKDAPPLQIPIVKDPAPHTAPKGLPW